MVSLIDIRISFKSQQCMKTKQLQAFYPKHIEKAQKNGQKNKYSVNFRCEYEFQTNEERWSPKF